MTKRISKRLAIIYKFIIISFLYYLFILFIFHILMEKNFLEVDYDSDEDDGDYVPEDSKPL